MAKKIGKRTIVVVRRTKVDKLSTPTPGAAPEHDVTGCAILPRTSHEEGKGWVVVDGRMVIAPYDADVLYTDHVKVDDETWEVDGVPGRYEKRDGDPKACIFYLKRQGT